MELNGIFNSDSDLLLKSVMWTSGKVVEVLESRKCPRWHCARVEAWCLIASSRSDRVHTAYNCYEG
jgi:hypothetical protein